MMRSQVVQTAKPCSRNRSTCSRPITEKESVEANVNQKSNAQKMKRKEIKVARLNRSSRMLVKATEAEMKGMSIIMEWKRRKVDWVCHILPKRIKIKKKRILAY